MVVLDISFIVIIITVTISFVLFYYNYVVFGGEREGVQFFFSFDFVLDICYLCLSEDCIFAESMIITSYCKCNSGTLECPPTPIFFSIFEQKY